ncbi:MAG: FtsQ-type POTRA domain-containing protein [Gammaproteobacteria bacterium]|nr:FtsQ-type POTRA domain-containing protein [Gammaproteobacteria bacterium]
MKIFGRGNRKRREEPRVKLPRIPWVALSSLLGLLVVTAGLYTGGHWVLNRPVERMVFNGKFERVSADQLESVLRKYMGKGFLAADLDAIQARVAALPWVATARVSRQWPDTLDVTVTEEAPAARWGADGLLNPQGRLFVRHTTHIPAELPQLNGPEGAEADVAARYVAIQEQLLARGLGVVALELDGRGAWTLLLSNGIGVRLGSQDVDARLDRFYEALDTVVTPVATDVQFVDMRYTNGFSIGWKPQRAVEAVPDEVLPPTELLPRA